MSTLERAISIAANAHEGDVDKGGEPYILHPLRLMMQFESDNYRIVAVLHDVIEDSFVGLNDLEKEGFSLCVTQALSALTRKKHQSYDEYINRVSNNPVAKAIKIADLKDNLNLLRLVEFGEADSKRVKKYLIALWELER